MTTHIWIVQQLTPSGWLPTVMTRLTKRAALAVARGLREEMPETKWRVRRYEERP